MTWTSKVVDGKRVYNPTYFCWRNIKYRCFNPRNKVYSYYGGRGITMCQRWKDSFDLFVSDMGESPIGMTLDRIDVNGNYEPGNCRWVSRKVNQRNQRRAKMITFRGVTKHFLDWSVELGIDGDTLRSRVFRRGWDIERAFTEPVRRRQKDAE